jgi:hypothetical protein
LSDSADDAATALRTVAAYLVVEDKVGHARSN